MQISRQLIEKAAQLKDDPAAYLADVERLGTPVGDLVQLSREDYDRISRAHPTRHPTAIDMVTNFAKAMSKWAKAGFATVDEPRFNERMKTCRACDRWDGTANAGLGKCRACGCTRLKLWLETETCPLDKWPIEGNNEHRRR